MVIDDLGDVFIQDMFYGQVRQCISIPLAEDVTIDVFIFFITDIRSMLSTELDENNRQVT